ncbi:PhnA-like protein [Iodidimonas sp. SYSU 1G8]|uniref:PhnA-like protein n=1 Tax=Iodidimonas sp. SYSU 1G8 TaxID=3133967 RepID=UPI0031FF1F03
MSVSSDYVVTSDPVAPGVLVAAQESRPFDLYRASWGGIFAGMFLALIIQFILNLLGVGIGIATLDPGTADNPSASSLSIAAAIWFVVAGLIAAFAGGYVASRLSGRPFKPTGGLQGLTTWAVTTLVVLFLLGSAVGGIVGGAFQGLSNLAGGVGNAVQAAAPAIGQSDPFAGIEEQVTQTTGSDPQTLRDAAVSAMRAAVTGDPARASEARERAAQAIARAQNIPVEDARLQVARYEQEYRATAEEVRRESIKAADTAASAASYTAILGVIALVLGAIAGYLGGVLGTVAPVTITTETVVRRNI